MILGDPLDDVAAGLAQSLLIGLLLGLEREARAPRRKREGFAGIRTFPLFTLGGFPRRRPRRSRPARVAGAGGSRWRPWPSRSWSSGRAARVQRRRWPPSWPFCSGPLPDSAAARWPPPWPWWLTLLLTLKGAAASARPRGSRRTRSSPSSSSAWWRSSRCRCLPDHGLGPYRAVNPRDVGFMVVLLTAVSLIGYLPRPVLRRGRASRWRGCSVASQAPPPSRSPSRGRRARPPIWRGRWPRASSSPRRCCTLAARSVLFRARRSPRPPPAAAPGSTVGGRPGPSLLLLRRASAPREAGPATEARQPRGARPCRRAGRAVRVVLLIARVAQAELARWACGRWARWGASWTWTRCPSPPLVSVSRTWSASRWRRGLPAGDLVEPHLQERRQLHRRRPAAGASRAAGVRRVGGTDRRRPVSSDPPDTPGQPWPAVAELGPGRVRIH